MKTPDVVYNITPTLTHHGVVVVAAAAAVVDDDDSTTNRRRQWSLIQRHRMRHQKYRHIQQK
jgi:hypothetical protein